MASAGRLRLALDHNFPEPILRALDEFVVDVELVPIRRIDRRLPEQPDEQPVDGLVQDRTMLQGSVHLSPSL